jgi:hypothetical protein
MNSIKPTDFRLNVLAQAVTLALFAGFVVSPVIAQDKPITKRFESVVPAAPVLGQGVHPATSKSINADWSDLAELMVSSDRASAPADGQSVVRFKVQALSKTGQPLDSGNGLITIEVDGARIRFADQLTAQTGADSRDQDRLTPGVQVKLVNGSVEFDVIAPSQARDVSVRVTAGDQTAIGVIPFSVELRDMVSVGIVEAKISLSAKKLDNGSGLQAIRQNDAFEQELRLFSRASSIDRAQYGARAAVFLKGKVKGDYLLTLALDTDKLTRDKIFRDIDPDAFYPVYGDSSEKGFDARSSTRLFVRVDKNRSYLLFGDYTTAAVGGARQLGQYSRSVNGLRWHVESVKVLGNVFVSRDSARQVIDEFSGRGVSGPYSVSNPNGLQNSERVELVVRDRNQPAVILRTNTLNRFVDYEFEPFSGRILFKSPVPSVDENLNPVSIRVTYEIDQGGPRFWLTGVDAQLKLSEKFEVGGSVVKDHNPYAPFTLTSVNASAKLSEKTSVVAEFANTKSVVNTSTFNVNSASHLFNQTGAVAGNAARVELRHESDPVSARVFVGRSDQFFNNPASTVNGGREELGAQGSYKLSLDTKLRADVIRSKDLLTGGKRQGWLLGAEHQLNEHWKIEAGIRQSKETVTPASAGSAGLVASNTLLSTSAGSGFGLGPSSNNALDPVSGLPVFIPGTTIPLSAANSNVTAPVDIDLLTVRAKIGYTPNKQWTVYGEAEQDTRDSARRLFALGAQYQFAERGRVYLRHELASTLAGPYALTKAQDSQSTVLGVDTSYMADGQLFSEYRLRDAVNGREAQAAVGLRNLWHWSDALKLTTNLERIKTLGVTSVVQAGALTPVIANKPNEATAVGVGAEYSPSNLWRSSGRLEWRQDDNYTNWLSTVSVARKLDRDWTLLGKNYWSVTDARSQVGGRKTQDRAIAGIAYRQTDTNLVNALARYEFRVEKDSLLGGDASQSVNAFNAGQLWDRQAHIVSLHADYHPSRRWWYTGRIAAKWVSEQYAIANSSVKTKSEFNAQLLGGRVMWDWDERWSIGAQANVLRNSSGKQYALGLEAAYIVSPNLYLTVGYNWRGFADRDLIDSNYTNRGVVLGIRWKFDEELFGPK